LGQLDDRLAWAVPTSPEGAAFKLREAAYFVDLDDEESAEVARTLLRRIACRVSRNQLRPIDLAWLRFKADGLPDESTAAPAAFIDGAREWLARSKPI
jgi:hypothetical protein